MPDMTVIAGIQEEVADIYGGAQKAKEAVKSAATSDKNYICKMMLNYYNVCYTALTSGITVAANAISAAKKVTSKIKSELSDINNNIENAFSSNVTALKSMPTEIQKIKLDVDNSANMPISTLVKNNVPLDSEYAKNIISGLNQVKTSVIFDLVPSSGVLNITALINSGKLRSDGISNSISLDYSTYSDKAKEKLSEVSSAVDNVLPTKASDLFGDSISSSFDSITSTLQNSVIGQLDSLESMFTNALSLGHVKEICVLMGLIQQYIEDYCTDLEIRKELANKPVAPVIEKAGGTVKEKAVAGDDSSSTTGGVTTSKYEYKFDFKQAAGVEEATQETKPIDTALYTFYSQIEGVKIDAYGVAGQINIQNGGTWLPTPYYSYYQTYVDFNKTNKLDDVDKRAEQLAAILHIDDEKSRAIFFDNASEEEVMTILKMPDPLFYEDVIENFLTERQYLSVYGTVNIRLTYPNGSLTMPTDCKALLFTTREDMSDSVVYSCEKRQYTTASGVHYICYTLDKLISSKTDDVPDFFKAYTNSSCTFRNLMESSNTTYTMYVFR